MQYKIPIQIENEDTIILGLSLRQLGIIIVGILLAFGIFNKLQNRIPNTVLIVLCVVVIGIFIIIAKFRTHEMTTLPFLLNMARYRINGSGPRGQGRLWTRGVDSWSPLETGYVQSTTVTESIRKRDKHTDDIEKHLKQL